MPTACWFSAALAEAESPSAKTGAASLASVIVTVIVWAAVLAEPALSEAVTMTT